jgi:hypothetical protein
MTPLDLKQRMTLVKFLTELLASRRRDVLLPEADEEFTQGERFAVKFGGRIAAWITVPRASRYSGSIKDKDKFLRWVKDSRPDEIVTVEQVRESYAEAVMKDVREHGGLFDKEAGEVVAVPGIEVTPGKSVPRVELEDDAEEIIGAAWRDGLDIGPLLALPAPEATA